MSDGIATSRLVLVFLCLASETLFAQLEVAGDLVVELDAAHESAGSELWVNTAPDASGDFMAAQGEVGLVELDGAPAVDFNGAAVYRSEEPAPDDIVGPDATRTVEVWARNASVGTEESMVSWGRRGGPDGTNFSFNYGSHDEAGAITHLSLIHI